MLVVVIEIIVFDSKKRYGGRGGYRVLFLRKVCFEVLAGLLLVFLFDFSYF